MKMRGPSISAMPAAPGTSLMVATMVKVPKPSLRVSPTLALSDARRDGSTIAFAPCLRSAQRPAGSVKTPP